MKEIKLLNRIFWLGTAGVISVHIFTGFFMSKEADFFVSKMNDIHQKVNDNKSNQDNIIIKRENLSKIIKDKNDTDYILAEANSLAILIKNDLLFMNKTALQKESNIPNLIKSVDNVFNSDLSLKPEAKYEFDMMLEEDKSPLDSEYINALRQDLVTFKSVIESHSSNETDITKEYLNILEKHYTDLSFLDNEQGIAIYNKWKTLRSNDDFQTLVFNQNIQQAWDNYFKSEFGDNISPIIYFLTGTFQK